MSSTGTKAVLLRATEKKLILDEEQKAIYTGIVDPQWNVFAISNGGYTLGILLNCAQNFVVRRIGKQQKDLLSCSTSYFAGVSAKVPFTVEVRLLKKGKSTSIVETDMLQKTAEDGGMLLCVRASAIFTDFASLRSDSLLKQVSILPNDFSAPVPPLISDPTDRSSEHPWWEKQKIPTVVEDKAAQDQAFQKDGLLAVQSMYFPEEHVDEVDMGSYNITALALYSDTSGDFNRMMPKRLHKLTNNFRGFWFATVRLSIEMAQPLPTLPLQKAVTRGKTRFLNEGRWCFEIEIWTHPTDADRLNLPKGTDSILLAVCKQQALSMSASVNKKTASKL
ncbi:uncharacterized protein FA14DRAFT_189626 [Meira miltonrushii]|uniref:Acyl-CoA thioesterase-like N-terminal HotDog domain-containing protein n=1 Tax=Meira miltonrushii TaxID=1280837 RepID=A0A316VDC7_9BASI|nr:uncharacterized protein FA14DRAFT_189626 [Meira miltonrushii]PWN35687.1 hypothetical protein FA14DRAFT_189626 [Meira miltonrushii]